MLCKYNSYTLTTKYLIDNNYIQQFKHIEMQDT